MEKERDNQATLAGGATTPTPAVDSPGAAVRSTCDAGLLVPPAERVAHSAGSLVQVLSETRRRTRWQKAWDFWKPTLVFLSILFGGAFALEQYLASQHEAAKARVEGLLSSASEALGSPDYVVQANAVRTLARTSEFSTYTVPSGPTALGRHMWGGLVGLPAEYPYFEQSWLIFRDFATSPRGSDRLLVSSAILREGAAWEHRLRRGGRAPAGWTGGSLLFEAQLPAAKANDLDLRGIQFGTADLTGADISGSNCGGCGLLGARLNAAIMRGSNLSSAYLAEATINEADLSFARLNQAILRRVHAKGVVFLQTDLSNADFANSRLDGSTFSQANLTRTAFTGASLRGVRFTQSDVSVATFDNADVEGADFTRAIGFSESLLRKARNSAKALVPLRLEAKK
jgi:uncharacterized protein YjbI with pentapeptide repeats